MYSATEIASYIKQRYKKFYNDDITEMKLHKLLYYVQRESIIQTNRPLFSELFCAYKFGPVMIPIRDCYKNDTFPIAPVSSQVANIVDRVFSVYGRTSPWVLAMMSHNEISWQNARIGVDLGENSKNTMANEDIVKDAERIKSIRKTVKKGL